MKIKRYNVPLTDEQKAARETMPKTVAGSIVALQYLNDKTAMAMEPAWREWCGKHPRRLWPDFLDSWADDKRRRNLA
jgi:hypothetical protein